MTVARRGLYASVRDIRDAANSIMAYGADGVLQHGTLVVDAVPEKFKTTTVLVWRRNGIQFTKAATTALVFSAAHPVTASKYGPVLIQIDDAGVVTTKIPGATQTTTMAYDTPALALAALPAVTAGNTYIGHFIIAADSGGWTAITDDITDASDLTTLTIVNATVVPRTAPSTLAT